MLDIRTLIMTICRGKAVMLLPQEPPHIQAWYMLFSTPLLEV